MRTARASHVSDTSVSEVAAGVRTPGWVSVLLRPLPKCVPAWRQSQWHDCVARSKAVIAPLNVTRSCLAFRAGVLQLESLDPTARPPME